MKSIKCITVLIFTLAFFIPTVILAYTGQYPWDPVYIAPTQETQNQNTEQRLKSQYGISAYYNCYPCAGKDTSNPYTQTSCLIQTEYCLERQVIKKEATCSSGYIYFNSRCVTVDQGCKEQYGQGSYYKGTTDENGKYSCDCSTGYKWNDQRTDCIIAPVVPVKTNNQICQDNYGLNSNWNGTKNVNGGLICDCKAGYEWNSNQTVCVKNEIIMSPEIKGASDNNLIPEGALIQVENGIDVYIVKYVGSKKFKRLILSPSVFNNYGHLKWEDVMNVSQAVLDSYTTSNLVRAVGDDKIYWLYAQGDTGGKRLVKSDSVFAKYGLDADGIYEINQFDRNSYIAEADLE